MNFALKFAFAIETTNELPYFIILAKQWEQTFVQRHSP